MIVPTGGMPSAASEDHAVIAALNHRTGAGLVVAGRAEFGKLGGAIFVEWPDGRSAVVTTFLGSLADAERVVDVLNYSHGRGLPVPRHDLVVDIGDRILFVQQRLRQGASRRLTPARVDAMVEINDRFANALTDRPDVPPVSQWFHQPGADSHQTSDLVTEHDPRARDVLGEIIRLTTTSLDETATGTDLVHVDLSAANVLFDENDSATAVVDWNLGAYRGDRLLALVQTRFDREWFVRSPNADAVETDAAHHLDEILADRIHPNTLRTYWAYWLLHHLHKAIRGASPTIIDWQLRMAESRLL